MKTQIEKILNSGKFCGVFTTDANKYSVGYLTDADGDFIRMERIDPYGNPDGVGCQRIASITKIETETKYEKDIELLFLHKGHSKKPVNRREDVLGSVLAEIQRGGNICSVELFDSGCDDITGFLKENTDGHLFFETVNEFGEPDGTATIERDAVSCVCYGSTDEEKLQTLFRLKNK